MAGVKLRCFLAALLVAVLLTGCNANAIVQPSRADIVEANREYLAGPAQMDVSIDLLRGEVVMYYASVVRTEGTRASWEGKGTVCYVGNYFTQDCVTVCSEEASYKKWRYGWSETDTCAPTVQISSWLDAISAGEGTYQKKPVVPADMDESLGVVTGETYCVELFGRDVNWNALTDVVPDTLFGGEDLLGSVTGCDIYLFFDTMDLKLEAVYITRETGEDWIEVAILVSGSEGHPANLPLEEERKEGYLWEEWQRSTASSTS